MKNLVLGPYGGPHQAYYSTHIHACLYQLYLYILCIILYCVQSCVMLLIYVDIHTNYWYIYIYIYSFILTVSWTFTDARCVVTEVRIVHIHKGSNPYNSDTPPLSVLLNLRPKLPVGLTNFTDVALRTIPWNYLW